MTSDKHPPRGVITVADGFWNLRGSFKIAGWIDIGTHASLVRRASGNYVLLDACALSEDVERWLLEMTEGGTRLDAVLHLHPFHTLSVRDMHARFPGVSLYGTKRHRRLAKELPWQALTTDDAVLHARFAGDLSFSVPRGVELIPENEKLHFASVLAIHPASHTLHVDDTFNYFRLPRLVRFIKEDTLRFHPTLSRVLEEAPDAAQAFRAWAEDLIVQCRDVDNLCAAHGAAYLRGRHHGAAIADRIERALSLVEPTLKRHEKRLGGR